MKILYITTIGATMGFFTSFIKSLIEEGNTVEIATNEQDRKAPDCYREWGCSIYQIDTSRSPLDKGNLAAIRQIKEIVGKNRYDIVHCHTPVAAMCTRLACRKARKQGTKVFYTAHGFHFYKGAPLKNWLLYYPVEWVCAHWTDVLITINKEDYALAKKKMHAGRVEYVPGVGVDLEKFGRKQADGSEKIKRMELRRSIGVDENDILLLSVGELNENKNHSVVIQALGELVKKNQCAEVLTPGESVQNDKCLDLQYAIAGRGEKEAELRRLAEKCGVADRVHFLGFCENVAEWYHAADVFVHPSKREGLPVSLMEAMAAGLPVVCSRIRGNVDLVDENGGCLFPPESVDECRMAIEGIFSKDTGKMADYNITRIRDFLVDKVSAKMWGVYDRPE